MLQRHKNLIGWAAGILWAVFLLFFFGFQLAGGF